MNITAAIFLVLASLHPTQDGFRYQDAWTSAPLRPFAAGDTCTQGEKDTCHDGCLKRYQTAYYKGARFLAASRCDATTVCTVTADDKKDCVRNVGCTCTWADEGAIKHTMF